MSELMLILSNELNFRSLYMRTFTFPKKKSLLLWHLLFRVVLRPHTVHCYLNKVLPEYFVRMLACLELPNLDFNELPIPKHHIQLIEKVVQQRLDAADASAGQPAHITASDIKITLQAFCDDPHMYYAKKRWLCNVLKVPKEKRQDPDYLSQLLETAVDQFLQELHANVRTGAPGSKHTLAVMALYHAILITWKKKNTGPMPMGPVFRMLANAEGNCRKQYLPQELCGEDVELAANRLPAYWMRMQKSSEQPVHDLSLPVASPPVMCWICGEGFMHNKAFFEHCSEAHGDYAEYRKRLFYRAQKDGFKALLPWVKRHMLESATFHLTYSIPGSCSLKWNHPEAFHVAKERCEVACVVCARKDWLESRFTVYLWRTADGASSYAELMHTDSGMSELLTSGEHLCFGNRDLIDKLLNTKRYSDNFDLIPQEHLYASSVLHPHDEAMSWLLHSRRVPLVADSRRVPSSSSAAQPATSSSSSAAQPVTPSSWSAAQPALRHKCAGVGDIDAVAHICYDCATCLCVEDKLIKMPRFALANAMWIGRQHPLLQNASLGLRLLLGLGRPCFRKLFLGAGRREDQESGTTGNHVLVSQGSPSLSDVLPPSSRQLSDSFVAVFGQDKEELSKCQVLSVSRSAYKILVEERVRVNHAFGRTTIDQQAVDSLPENGVPQVLMECGVQMEEVDKYSATRGGPGTVRDPLDATRDDDDDDASDEISDASSSDGHTENADKESPSSSVAPPASKKCELALNQFETPLGLDPTSTPDFVQHVAAFKAHLDLVQDAVKKMRTSEEQPGESSAERPADVDVQQSGAADVCNATAQAAAEEECYRAVVDLREVAQKLDKHQFQDKAKLLENVDNKAMFVTEKASGTYFIPWSVG